MAGRHTRSAGVIGPIIGRVSGQARDGGAPRRVADLRSPFLMAHRGMANVYPENTLAAYRGSASLGVDVIEPDCWLDRDGELVCLHDATVDRTTDGSGRSDELTLPARKALHVDAGRWFAAAWPNTLPVPTLTNVLDELGGLAVLCPEAKNVGAGRAIVDQLLRYDVLDAAIVQSFMRAELGPAVAAGGNALLLTATSRYDPAEVRAAGIRYLGLSAALPPALVAPARAAGLQVAVWVVDRRVDVRPWLAAGVVGVFSNDPLYLSGRSPVLMSDPFRTRTFYHGHLPSSIAGDRGTFCAPAAWGYRDSSAQYKGALQGWAVPATATGWLEITLSVRIEAVSADDGWAGAFFAAVDDRSFDDADRFQPGVSGYHVRIHRSGRLDLRIVDDGIARAAADTATSPIEAGESTTLSIAVTPTHVTVTRTDTVSPGSLRIADATHRGAYLHLGRRAAAVAFFDISIGSRDAHT
jgi:glycerophosphoryl diester phosphodiesterase